MVQLHEEFSGAAADSQASSTTFRPHNNYRADGCRWRRIGGGYPSVRFFLLHQSASVQPQCCRALENDEYNSMTATYYLLAERILATCREEQAKELMDKAAVIVPEEDLIERLVLTS